MPCQTMPQSTSHAKLEGVYKQVQPGSRPHPALKHRQQQRNALHRSASLVLAKNQRGTCEDMDGPLPLFVDNSRSTTPAQGEKRPHRATQRAALLEDLPPRLEDCLQRLAAADRELERCRNLQAYSRSPPTILEEPMMATRLQRKNSGAVGATGTSAPTTPAAQQQRGKAKPGTPQPGLKPSSSGSVGIGEPAPEPPMASTPMGKNVAFSGLDIPPGPAVFDDAYADPASDQLGGGHALIGEDFARMPPEMEGTTDPEVYEKSVEVLLELDKKWHAVDQERIAALGQRDELAGRLSASKDLSASLGSQVKSLELRLQEADNEIQALRKSLGVSEETAQALLTKTGELETRETMLHSQATQLQSQLDASHSEVVELTGKLAETEKSRDAHLEHCGQEHQALLERLRIAEAAQEATVTRAESAEKALAEAHASLAEERKTRAEYELTAANDAKHRSEVEQLRMEEERQRLARGSTEAQEEARKVANLETERQRLAARTEELEQELVTTRSAAARDLAAANERSRAAEEETEKMRKTKDEAVKAAETFQDDARAAPPAPNYEAAAALDNADDVFTIEAMGMPSLAAVPNLLYAAALPPVEAGAEAGDGETQEIPTLLPTHCTIDLMSSEIRLQTLTPIGPMRKIRLEDIESITRPDAPRGTVDIEFVEEYADTQKVETPQTLQRLRLRAVDEHCVSALIAAISMPNRTMPGDSLGTSPRDESPAAGEEDEECGDF